MEEQENRAPIIKLARAQTQHTYNTLGKTFGDVGLAVFRDNIENESGFLLHGPLTRPPRDHPPPPRDHSLREAGIVHR